MLPVKSTTLSVSGREVRLYNDEHFSKLRRLHGIPDNFLDAGWDMTHEMKKSDAKGGALMAFIGHVFVVKDLNTGDHGSLLEISASYVNHATSGETLLAPIYLHWQDVEDGKNYFVMGSTCGKGPFLTMYDLKGCDDDKTLERDGKPIKVVHKRFFNLCMWCGTCAWDDARVVYFEGKVKARKVQFTVTEVQREEVLRKLQRDTDWLKQEDLMDYSLLVGIKEGPSGSFSEKRRLPCQQALVRANGDGSRDVAMYVGIIDYLQKWNFGKVVAKMIKVLEHRKATIKPEPYGDRFNEHFKAAFVAA